VVGNVLKEYLHSFKNNLSIMQLIFIYQHYGDFHGNTLLGRKKNPAAILAQIELTGIAMKIPYKTNHNISTTAIKTGRSYVRTG
jgi:hypothetical protein